VEAGVTAVQDAFGKTLDFFTERHSRPAILARQLGGREAPDDDMLAQILSNERRAATRADGSIGGSLVATAWAAIEMMDLGSDWLQGSLDRLLGWVVNHIESNLPADPPPLVLPNGARFDDPEHASVAARCLGLRALVRARRGERPGIARLMDDLAVAKGRQPPTLDLSASVLSALALAPPQHRHHLDGLIGRMGRAQQDDGTWADADLMHVLDALIVAGIRAARAVVVRAAPALIARQRDDGSFDAAGGAQEERALIALRALQIALED
jgi:hypothetical protein